MDTKPTTDLYFEAHVTIDPVSTSEEVLLFDTAKNRGFTVAELYMKKNTGLRSRLDDFMTSRSNDYDDIVYRTTLLVAELQAAGFSVRRWKIENTLVDIWLIERE